MPAKVAALKIVNPRPTETAPKGSSAYLQQLLEVVPRSFGSFTNPQPKELDASGHDYVPVPRRCTTGEALMLLMLWDELGRPTDRRDEHDLSFWEWLLNAIRAQVTADHAIGMVTDDVGNAFGQRARGVVPSTIRRFCGGLWRFHLNEDLVVRSAGGTTKVAS